MTALEIPVMEQDIRSFTNFVDYEGDIKLEDIIFDNNFSMDTQPSLFNFSPENSPISSPIYGTSPLDASPPSDYQPPDTSSSDEEALDFSATLPFDQELVTTLGLDGMEGNYGFSTPANDLFNMNTLIGDQNSAFSSSCLPPLPVVQSSGDEDDKRSKKRRRNQMAEPAPVVKSEPKFKPSSKFTALSSDELLQLDSTEIEDYIRALSASRTLPPSEEKELKRIRRLIKNREYAQSSRDKKKQYMEEMEKKLNDSEEARLAVERKLRAVEMENKTLKMQLAKIGTAIKKDPVILERLKYAAKPTSKNPPFVKTGIALFMIVFSFGLFFRGEMGGAPMVGPATSSHFSTARTLLGEYMEPENVPHLLKTYAPHFVLDLAHRYIWTAPEPDELASFDSALGGVPAFEPQLDPLVPEPPVPCKNAPEDKPNCIRAA